MSGFESSRVEAHGAGQQTPAEASQAPLRPKTRRGRAVLLLGLALLLSVIAVAGVTRYLAPPLQSAAETRVVGDASTGAAEAVEIRADAGAHGAVGTIVPDAGWSVQPMPRAEGEWMLRSPDRVMSVRVSAGELDAAGAGEAGAPFTETLSNGTVVRHLTRDGGIVAELALPGGTVLLEATVAPGAELAAYRRAFAELLLRVS